MTPLQTYDLLEIGQGPALLLIGLLGLMLWAAVQFRNPAAVIAWAFVVLFIVFSGLFGIGFELVWIAVMATVILLVVGVVARWTQ